MAKDRGDIDYSIDDQTKLLKATVTHLKKELDKYKEPPLLVCDVIELLGDKAIVKLVNGNEFLVNISHELLEKVAISDRVLTEQKSLVIVEKLEEAKPLDIEQFVLVDKPLLNWECIGGLEEQIREIKDVVELPLKRPELFKEVGIDSPKGVLLYGPSGTGKTILAKAVAASTNSTFIEIVGSELVQKFIGEGAKLVKRIFNLARERAPTIIFIDEIDSIAATRVDSGTSGEREVQRTFMQLLSELDGFKELDNVKVIGATNRVDILDTALLRPGRLDRLIVIPLPNLLGREEIFKIHSSKMGLDEVDLHDLAEKTDGFSGAEIKSVCTEAGYFAIREDRKRVIMGDFLKAIDKVTHEENSDHLEMFG